MDNIYTLLNGIGIDVPEDKKKAFEESLFKNYKTVNEFNNIQTKLTNAETSRDEIKAKYDNDMATRDSDLQKLKDQLKNAGEDGEKLATLQSQFDTLSTTYADAKTQYENKLNEQRYEFLARTQVDKLNFTSASAKRAFYNDLMAKKLQLENDTLLGFDDFVNIYKEQDAGAFATDNTNNSSDKPMFSSKSDKIDQSDNNKQTSTTKKVKIW